MAMNSLSNSTSNSTTCSTPECVATAKSILNDVDFNIDPCSDFYEYTCGGWLAKNTIPESRVSAGTLDKAYDVNMEVMRSILEGAYDDVYKSLISSYDGFHQQDQEEADKRNFNTMQKSYKLCMNTNQIDSLGPTPIYQDIAIIENVLFPIQDGTQVATNRTTASISQTLIKLNQLGISSLFEFIYLNSANLGLPSKEYYEVPKTLAAYKTGLNDVLINVIGGYSNGTQDTLLRDTESKKFNFVRWSNEKIAAAVDRFIDFETKLADISLKAEDMRDPIKLYNPINLSEFQTQNALIDWASIFKALIPSGIAVPDRIIDRAPSYFDKLNQLLASGKVTEQTLQEYFVITFVTNQIKYLDSTSREAYRKMKAAISSAWLECIPQLEWLDDQTKAKAIEKVNLIAHKVAYSIASPDIRQPLSIEKYNEGIYVNETSFYDTGNIIVTWFGRKMWKEAGQKVDKDKWYMSPQTVNAYYTSNGNEIVIPAGIMQSPMYDNAYPEYFNYGGMGMIVGHEITHAFDSAGRKYDGHGLLSDWWTNETSAKFEEKSQCFVNQYSKFIVSGPGNTSLNVNGKLTLSENLADNGGASVSFAAYKKLDKQEQALPGLEHLSPEALFYINMGRTWCGRYRPEFEQQLIYTDTHSPLKARINGTVSSKTVLISQRYSIALPVAR
ncbi:hypothetical protein [Parasitella parasitica]|uniref:Peptidase M13 N-terminal domain-containing protein n=1 Tax=Parasitella parasitica TaxID=35722 RepID=A0A0B7NGK2_9FUNG|nr:hypothetical protein [Parasitella parasitica]